MNRCDRRSTRALAGSIGVLLGAATALLARAQGTLEEVIVTAERRETRLQDTPAAVTAISAEEIRAASVANVTDVGRLAPNMFFKGGANSAGTANNAQIYMRGIGQTDFLPTADPGVGLYLDEVYLGRSVGGVLTLPDVERIEVVRGPQGTLFGRNTIGGAVQVVTRKPVMRELESWAQVTLGNDNWQKVEGALNLPLGERVAARIAAQYNSRDGHGRSTTIPLEFGTEQNATLRAQLKWEPTERFHLLLSGDYYHQNQTSMPGICYYTDFTVAQSVAGLYNGFMPALAGAPPLTPADLQNLSDLEEPFDSSATGPSRDDNDSYGATVTATWKLSDEITLKSISAYRDMDAAYANDADEVSQLIGWTDEKFTQHQFSQELQISGSTDRLEWVAGGYYFRENAVSDNTVPLVPGLFTALEGLPGPFIPLAPGVLCPAAPPAPCAGGRGNPFNVALDISQRPYNDITATSYAGFGQASYRFAERWSATLGVRASKETKELYAWSTKVESSRVLGTTLYNVPPTRRKASFDDFSPKVGVEFKASDNLLIYSHYSEGFRSGTFNGRSGAQRAVQAVDPEGVENVELGFKSELAGRTVRLNAALFYTTYSDIQFISVEPDPAAGFIVFLRNADEAEVYGLELESVARLGENFLGYANVGYTHSEVTKIDPLLTMTTGVAPGAQLRKSPELTFAMGGQYTVHTGIGRFVGRADYNWQDEVFHEATNAPIAREDSYGLLNLRVAWQSLDDHWEIAGFMRNAGDETYFNSLFVQGGTQAVAYPARSREYGLSFLWRY